MNANNSLKTWMEGIKKIKESMPKTIEVIKMKDEKALNRLRIPRKAHRTNWEFILSGVRVEFDENLAKDDYIAVYSDGTEESIFKRKEQ